MAGGKMQGKMDEHKGAGAIGTN